MDPAIGVDAGEAVVARWRSQAVSCPSAESISRPAIDERVCLLFPSNGRARGLQSSG